MRKYKYEIGDFAQKYGKAVAVLAAFLLIGVILGAFYGATVSADKLKETEEILCTAVEGSLDKGKSLLLFLSAFKKTLIPLFLIWLCGFSVYFIPFIFGELLVRGFKIGFSTGVLIRLFELKGLKIALEQTGIINLIFLPILICLSVVSIKNAVDLRRIKGNKAERKRLFARKTATFCAVLIVSAVCGMAESYILFSLL